ncbi:hypothetical protein D3C75_1389910 [compost metagenome]
MKLWGNFTGVSTLPTVTDTASAEPAATVVLTKVPYSMRAKKAGGTSSAVIETLVTPGFESL